MRRADKLKVIKAYECIPGMRQHQQEAGFSIVEIFLVVFVVAVLALSGVVLYQHHKQSGAKKGASTSQVQVTAKHQNIINTQPAPSTTQYLTINEWGARAPYSGSLKLSYTMSPDDRTATFSSDRLTALSSDCTGRGGSIVRWASTDQVSEGPTDVNTPTAAKAFASANPSTYAHIGNYYFSFAHDQASCGDFNTTATLQSQTNDAVKALASNFQTIPKTASN